MEDEIDLRQYLEVLIRRWKWIVALTVISVLAAAAISFLVLQPTYEAKALVLITGPRYQLRFDPRVETISDVEKAYRAYPSLATSDDLLERVLGVLESSLPENERTLRALKGKVDASTGADPSLLELKVTNGDQEQAAQVANIWAEQYVGYVNELYGRRSEDVVFFSEQLESARVALESAEDALIEFQARNQAGILDAELTSARQAQTDYLADQRAIARITQDIQALRDQLSQQPSSRASSLADDLTALLLQIKAFNAESTVPVQLQVSSAESLSGKTVSEQMVFLDDLMVNVQAKSADIDAQLSELGPEILKLQQALEETRTELDRLTRDRDVAKNTYLTLANKVEEARIAAQDEAGEVQLASRASVPTSPVGPRKMMNVVIAGVLGLFLGIFLVFFAEYWQASREAGGE
jgi:succinoglycan biosynthesis transport protein ExoP